MSGEDSMTAPVMAVVMIIGEEVQRMVVAQVTMEAFTWMDILQFRNDTDHGIFITILFNRN